MLKPIARSRRDGHLYPGSPKTLDDFIDPKHLLRRIDVNFDFAAFSFLDMHDAPWIGRPAIHPEVVIRVSRYVYTLRRAARLNATVQYQREIRRRKTTAEAVFVHFDRLGWDRARLRGWERVVCQGSIAALAQNLLKALTKRRSWGREAEAQRGAATLSQPLVVPSPDPVLPPTLTPSFVSSPEGAARFSTGRMSSSRRFSCWRWRASRSTLA